jgi:hypothetical protein
VGGAWNCDAGWAVMGARSSSPLETVSGHHDNLCLMFCGTAYRVAAWGICRSGRPVSAESYRILVRVSYPVDSLSFRRCRGIDRYDSPRYRVQLSGQLLLGYGTSARCASFCANALACGSAIVVCLAMWSTGFTGMYLGAWRDCHRSLLSVYESLVGLLSFGIVGRSLGHGKRDGGEA